MATRTEKIRFVIIRTIGNFLFLFSLWGTISTLGPAVYIEAVYRINTYRNVRYAVKTDEKPGQVLPKKKEDEEEKFLIDMSRRTVFGQLTGGNTVEFLSPVSSQFGIIIPKIGANAPIFPNVDAGNENEYLDVLKKGVAHAAGTVFPGVAGNSYLFAHSTDAFWNVGRYNAIFYLIKELETGDEIDVFFRGKRHLYRVTAKLIVDASQVHYLTDQTPYEQLTLQTCWPPGTTLKRLLVIARPQRDLQNLQ